MDMLVIVSDEIHTAALARARTLGRPLPDGTGTLKAPLTDDAIQWLDKIWDASEAALLRARRQGKAAAKELVEKVDALLKEASAALADRFQALRQALTMRLNEYITDVIDAAIKLVRPSVTIGDRLLHIASVSVEQRIMLSGSVKASLQEIVELVAEGELTLSAEYAFEQSKTH